MRRRVIWLQVLLGWLPVGVLYAALIGWAHPGAPIHFAALAALLSVTTAALLSLPVQRLADRVSWPHPFRLGFAGLHMAAAVGYAVGWQGLTRVVQWAMHGNPMVAFGYRLVPSLIMGVWLYVMVAGVAYATRATERAARAEALAARSHLATLRAQLHPHFLFNSLHTVVQLIPTDPRRATQAAEQIAGLLRTTIEEDRDLVSLAEEAAFVEKYLGLERIRFGDRLRVRVELSDEARDALIPSFALQTLVENSVRHGAAPRVEPTEITVTARATPDAATVTVHDTGYGASPEQIAQSQGTGLKRLRDRLAVLYGARARLDLAAGTRGGFTATLTVPRVPVA
jgi:hypothetical protein